MQKRYVRCSVIGCEKNSHHDGNGKAGLCSMHYTRRRKYGDPLVERIEPKPAQDWLAAHVSYVGDGCLIWPFAIGSDGYAKAHRPENNRLTNAARLMCEAVHGPAPSRKHETAHSCGRGASGCVHPEHVRWALPSENHADKIGHGTTNRGERQWKAFLTEADIREIRRLAPTMTQEDLARQFGTVQSHISKILSGSGWGWVS